jgi:hypothetical protein
MSVHESAFLSAVQSHIPTSRDSSSSKLINSQLDREEPQMQESVSSRRVSILAWATALAIGWAIFVVPGGAPWTGLVWLAALGFLLVSSTVLIVGAASPAPAVVPATEKHPTGRNS